MNNPITEYITQAIDPAVLSVLDVELDGKVVSAQDWKTLWQLVFNRINRIDAFCLKVEDLRVSLEQSRQEMFDAAHRVDVKYAALEKSFVHYGTEAPTNEHVKFWVQPVTDVNSNLLVTYPVLQDAIAKSGSLPPVTSADNGKLLQVVNGAWAIVEIPVAEGGAV